MTKEQEELRRYVTMVRDIIVRHHTIPPGWHYHGADDFLLREASFYEGGGVVEWKASLPKACFRNAALYAELYGLRYVEGYAQSIIPVHHGWCVDSFGKVVEVTWDSLGSAYFGVEFKPMKVRRGSVLFNEANASIYKKAYKQPKRLKEHEA